MEKSLVKEEEISGGNDEIESEEEDAEVILNEILQLDVIKTGISSAAQSFLIIRDVY